ncbi:MAG: Gfo/Idh/MocA family oxidoreductase [Verrucomicrobia bacterium]|nr:Gfo/Idh/MocA family oxidoreductase [Verrucomicrobiota bacterium]MBO7391589.1 Gfo/Idh/MocA family oxidoreductase [Verrucomicrobiota bacterium]
MNKTNRRHFFKQVALGGLGAAGLALGTSFHTEAAPKTKNNLLSVNTKRSGGVNMCGFAAPKLETVRVGFIGVGNRGFSNMRQMTYLEGVQIKAICDIVPFRIDEAQKCLADQKLPAAKVYTGKDDSWKALCEDPEIDLISIAVPRGPLHAAISIYAMKCGKHVAVEVPVIATLDEAWEVVETAEKTRRHCMMMENCCYDFFELLTLNMARQGFFGDIIHADAGYIHYQEIYNKPRDNNMWRLHESQIHTGNIYPTHGLGPVAQIMDINHGDRFAFLVSMSSNDFMLGDKVAELAQTDPFYKPYDTHTYRGNINTSIIRTVKGKTIMLQHDTTSPRIYTRLHIISGTRGCAQKYPEPGRIAIGHEWVNETKLAELTEQYTPVIVKRIGEMAKQIGGHGGMDFLMTWRLIDCLRNGLPLDIDVYDSVSWSSIMPASERSVRGGSIPVEIPDFTRGAWKTNPVHDISRMGENATTVRKI